MGSPKALLAWKGTTLLDHQVTALREAGVDCVIVVLGHRPEILQPILEDKQGVTWAINPDYAQGKTTSIKAGLRELESRYKTDEDCSVILILNVDQPRSQDTVRDVLQRHREAGKLITIPTFKGKGGHPIALDPVLLPELRSIVEENFGVKAVVQAHSDSTQRTEMPTAEVLWDLNTPEEYQAALQSQS
jgi:molybdenum cofactor cytidylyltransferase